MTERTLCIIKPDAVAAGHAGEILARIEEEGFKVLGCRMLRLRPEQARVFYEVHKDKPFYESLVAFMTEGPVIVLALEREDAINKLREVMGKTNPAEAADGTIRRQFGTNIERNAVHGSDGPETAQRELRFFFCEADLV